MINAFTAKHKISGKQIPGEQKSTRLHFESLVRLSRHFLLGRFLFKVV
jgi:hypothetical protein